jgi:NAD(P)H dehydrogenase (quinone)
MLAVTGATGHLGRLVIDALLRRVPANTIVALARNPSAAEDLAARGVMLREADYDRPETLAPALAGVEKLLLISGSEVGRRVPQHAAVIAAAKAAGVGFVAYTSILNAAASPLALAREHQATEAALADSGLGYALLRNGWYAENYAGVVGMALQHGAVAGSAGAGRISAAARRDYAEAAAAVLTSAEDQAGKVYELAGDTGFTMAEFAAEIAAQSGRPVAYADMPEAEYARLLVGAGLPEALAGVLADSDAGAARGALFEASRTLSTLIGRPTTPIAETVAAALRG